MDVKKIGLWLNDLITVSDNNGNTATGTLEMTANINGIMQYKIKNSLVWWPHAEKAKL